MVKYIWITIGFILLLLALGFKQAPKEPPVVVPEEVAEISDAEVNPTVSESGNITLSDPAPDATVGSPLLVKGEARTEGQTFTMQLKDADGNSVAEKTVTYTTEEGAEFGSFGELLVFDAPNTDAGSLMLFTNNPQDAVTIPVVFE